MVKKILTLLLVSLVLVFSIRFLGILFLLKVLSHYVGIKVTVFDALLITIGLHLATFTIKVDDK